MRLSLPIGTTILAAAQASCMTIYGHKLPSMGVIPPSVADFS
jgi:hypothetical protein